MEGPLWTCLLLYVTVLALSQIVYGLPPPPTRDGNPDHQIPPNNTNPVPANGASNLTTAGTTVELTTHHSTGVATVENSPPDTGDGLPGPHLPVNTSAVNSTTQHPPTTKLPNTNTGPAHPTIPPIPPKVPAGGPTTKVTTTPATKATTHATTTTQQATTTTQQATTTRVTTTTTTQATTNQATTTTQATATTQATTTTTKPTTQTTTKTTTKDATKVTANPPSTVAEGRSSSHPRITSTTEKQHRVSHVSTAKPGESMTSENNESIIPGIEKNSFTAKVLLPVVAGIILALFIVLIAWSVRSCMSKNGNGSKRRLMDHDMAPTDRVMLLAESSEDEF